MTIASHEEYYDVIIQPLVDMIRDLCIGRGMNFAMVFELDLEEGRISFAKTRYVLPGASKSMQRVQIVLDTEFPTEKDLTFCSSHPLCNGRPNR